MSNFEDSHSSLEAASKNRAQKSRFGGSGTAGFKDIGLDQHKNTVKKIDAPENGFDKIEIGLAWNNVIITQPEGLINKMLAKKKRTGVDLDLGCLYQLKNDTRGCLQGFGELFGNYNNPPFIHHSGDEKTGDKEGHDEILEINGKKWSEIERIVIYTYIYEGPQLWADIEPEIELNIAGIEKMTYDIRAYKENIPMYGFVLLENIDGDIKLTDVSEYFAGHAELSRAFGFGIRWEDGEK